MQPYFPNILLLSGTGRNVGKTTLACAIIKKFRHLGIVAVKVSPHWHPQAKDSRVIFQDRQFFVMEEQEPNNPKDSSRMLRSGAQKVYYVQTREDKSLLKVLELILQREAENQPMVIESAALGRFVQPAVHLRLSTFDPPSDKNLHPEVPVDFLVMNDGNGLRFDMERLEWKEETWILRKS